MKASVESIAKVCHAANRGYCQTLGDNSQAIWECSPKWQRDSAIAGVSALLENPKLTPEESHEAWMLHKVKQGWKYGEKKDEKKKEHPCIVPYGKLPDHQRVKDVLFGNIVRSFIEPLVGTEK